MLLGVADVTCCVVFILFWPVDWAAAAPMAAGFLAGSMIGPSLTRRIPGHHTPHHRRARRARARHPPMGRKLATAISHMPAHGQRSPDQGSDPGGQIIPSVRL